MELVYGQSCGVDDDSVERGRADSLTVIVSECSTSSMAAVARTNRKDELLAVALEAVKENVPTGIWVAGVAVTLDKDGKLAAWHRAG